MLKHNIKKTVVLRLFYVWVCLSMCIGAVVYYYELKKIDDFVVNLAIEEADRFVQDEARLLLHPTVETLEMLQIKARQHLHASQFLVVEFYDKEKNRLFEVIASGMEDVEKELNKLDHASLIGHGVNFEKIAIRNSLFIRVATPLHIENGYLAGYFEGIYHVDEKVLGAVRGSIAFSLFLVVSVILITSVVLYPVIISLNNNVLRFSSELLRANIGTIETLGSAIAKRDSDTSEHNYRVTLYAIALGKELKLAKDQMRELVKGAFLHDCGKIAIADRILLKPGKLDDDEFALMRTHVLHGVDIVKGYSWLSDAVNIVRHHHERYDGTGYLEGLGGEDIPVTARIFSIVDVFDALTSKRPYKEPFPYEKSISIMNEESGKHFDPHILSVFLGISERLFNDIVCSDQLALQSMLQKHLSAYFDVSEV